MKEIRTTHKLLIINDSYKYLKILKGVLFTRLLYSTLFALMLFCFKLLLLQKIFNNSLFISGFVIVIILIVYDFRNSLVLNSVSLHKNEVLVRYKAFFLINKELSFFPFEYKLIPRFEKSNFRNTNDINHYLIFNNSNLKKVQFRMQRDDIVELLVKYYEFYNKPIPQNIQFSLHEISKIRNAEKA